MYQAQGIFATLADELVDTTDDYFQVRPACWRLVCVCVWTF